MYYTINELAAKLGVTRITVGRMVADGRLPKGFKLGPAKTSPVRFPRDATDAAIAAMERR